MEHSLPTVIASAAGTPTDRHRIAVAAAGDAKYPAHPVLLASTYRTAPLSQANTTDPATHVTEEAGSLRLLLLREDPLRGTVDAVSYQ